MSIRKIAEAAFTPPAKVTAPGVVEGTYESSEHEKLNAEEVIKKMINDHYVKMLAVALKRAGIKSVSPEKNIAPRFGYMITHAPNVNPDVLAKLKDADRWSLTGSYSSGMNVNPKMLQQAVAMYNAGGQRYLPMEWQAGGVKEGPKLALKEPWF